MWVLICVDVRCGYATIHDVTKKDYEDRMESFFLSETCKYLYLVGVCSFTSQFLVNLIKLKSKRKNTPQCVAHFILDERIEYIVVLQSAACDICILCTAEYCSHVCGQ